jgi:hypothetical protein
MLNEHMNQIVLTNYASLNLKFKSSKKYRYIGIQQIISRHTLYKPRKYMKEASPQTEKKTHMKEITCENREREQLFLAVAALRTHSLKCFIPY